MRISIFGLGYVGCVTAACLARNGHTIVGVDVNPLKVEMVASGQSPVVEPGLDDLIREAVNSGKLRVSLDGDTAVLDSDISLICVGTPSNENGSLKLDFVEHVCRQIGSALALKENYHVVVVRSTVLPGTLEDKLIPVLEEFSGRKAGVGFGVCINPEFLREGSAIHDYYRPSLVLIGEYDSRSGEVLEQILKPIDAPIVRTDIGIAEMVKYASNAFHGLKVVFANEIGNLCKAQGIDGLEVMDIFAMDKQLNISSSYLKPGFAFGGSCLPKDLRALLYRAKELDVECQLLNAIIPSNRHQVDLGIKLVEKTGYKKIGILGVSFKAGTDDLRESPAINLAETLIGRGYQIRIFDAKVQLSQLIGANKSYLEKEIPHIASLICSSIEDLVSESEVIVVTSGSQDYDQVYKLVNHKQILVDLVGTARNNHHNNGNYRGIGW